MKAWCFNKSWICVGREMSECAICWLCSRREKKIKSTFIYLAREGRGNHKWLSTFMWILCKINFWKIKHRHKKTLQLQFAAAPCLSLVPFSDWNTKVGFPAEYHLQGSTEEQQHMLKGPYWQPEGHLYSTSVIRNCMYAVKSAQLVWLVATSISLSRVIINVISSSPPSLCIKYGLHFSFWPHSEKNSCSNM